MKTEYQRVAVPAVRKVGRAEECGTEGKVQGHHHNGYIGESALDVVWLCRPCHQQRHGRRGRLPSWERGAEAYKLATGRQMYQGRTYTFSDWSMPKHLLKSIRRLWNVLRTDEERAAIVALVNELASETAA